MENGKSLLHRCDKSLFNIDKWHLIRCTKEKIEISIVHCIKHHTESNQGNYMGMYHILKGECDICFEDIPKDLVGIWTLYNFDQICEVS